MSALYEHHPAITRENVRKLLNYNPKTGELKWAVTRARAAKKGDLAGVIHPLHGYVVVTLYGQKIPGHRLAWFMHHGVWPFDKLICQSEDKENLAIDNWKPQGQTLLIGDELAHVVKARERARRWRANRKAELAKRYPAVAAAMAQREADDEAHRQLNIDILVARETNQNQFRNNPSGLARPPRKPKP